MPRDYTVKTRPKGYILKKDLDPEIEALKGQIALYNPETDTYRLQVKGGQEIVYQPEQLRRMNHLFEPTKEIHS